MSDSTNMVLYKGKTLEIVPHEKALVIKWPRTLMHYHTYGKLSKFFEGLKKGEIWVTRCLNKACEENRFWFPPRADCSDCLQSMNWEKLPPPVIGEIYTFTKVEYPGVDMELTTPYYQIDIKLEGSATIPKGYLLYGEPYIGMKVMAVFRFESSVNTILDLAWVPV